MFDTVKEERTDHPMEIFTMPAVRKYRGIFSVLLIIKNSIFVTKETSRTKPTPAKHPSFMVGCHITSLSAVRSLKLNIVKQGYELDG